MPQTQILAGPIRKLFRFFDYCTAFLMFCLLVEVCTVIVTRQLGLSWVWLYDIIRWTLAWLVFFGAVPLAARGEHLTVDIAVAALPTKMQMIGRVCAGAATCAVAGLIVYYGGLEVIRMYTFNERSMSGAFPAYIGYSVLPAAFGFLMIAGLIYMTNAIVWLFKASQ